MKFLILATLFVYSVGAFPAVPAEEDPRAGLGSGLINLIDPFELFHTATPAPPAANYGYNYDNNNYDYKPTVKPYVPVKPYKPAPYKPAPYNKYPTTKPYAQPSNLNVYLTLPLVPPATVPPTTYSYPTTTTARPYSSYGMPNVPALPNLLPAAAAAALPGLAAALPAAIDALHP